MEGKLDSEPKKLSHRKDWICSKRQRAHPGKHDFFAVQPVWKITSQCTKVVFANDFTSYLFAGTHWGNLREGFAPKTFRIGLQGEQEMSQLCSVWTGVTVKWQTFWTEKQNHRKPLKMTKWWWWTSYTFVFWTVAVIFVTVAADNSTSSDEPRFLIQPSDVHKRVGQSVVLPCRVKNRNGGRVQWTRDGFGLGSSRETDFPRYSVIGNDKESKQKSSILSWFIYETNPLSFSRTIRLVSST